MQLIEIGFAGEFAHIGVIIIPVLVCDIPAELDREIAFGGSFHPLFLPPPNRYL